MNPSPARKKIRPERNWSHKYGKGACKIPNTISRISLMPKAAMNPGINIMIRAMILIISFPLLKFFSFMSIINRSLFRNVQRFRLKEFEK